MKNNWDGNDRRTNDSELKQRLMCVETLIKTTKELFESRIQAQEKALELARFAMEKRLDGMNEFRDTLRDQASKFITRTEHEIIMNRYDIEIKELNKSKDILTGKADASGVYIAWALAIISLIVGIIDFIVRR